MLPAVVYVLERPSTEMTVLVMILAVALAGLEFYSVQIRRHCREPKSSKKQLSRRQTYLQRMLDWHDSLPSIRGVTDDD